MKATCHPCLNGPCDSRPQLTNVQCVDIEFVEPGDSRLPTVNESNCSNSTEIGFGQVYTITTLEPPINGEADASTRDGESSAEAFSRLSWVGWLPLVVGSFWVVL